MRVVNLENSNRKFTKSVGNFHVLEYIQDASVSPMNAVDEYFMSKMKIPKYMNLLSIIKCNLKRKIEKEKPIILIMCQNNQ